MNAGSSANKDPSPRGSFVRIVQPGETLIEVAMIRLMAMIRLILGRLVRAA